MVVLATVDVDTRVTVDLATVIVLLAMVTVDFAALDALLPIAFALEALAVTVVFAIVTVEIGRKVMVLLATVTVDLEPGAFCVIVVLAIVTVDLATLVGRAVTVIFATVIVLFAIVTVDDLMTVDTPVVRMGTDLAVVNARVTVCVTVLGEGSSPTLAAG